MFELFTGKLKCKLALERDFYHVPIILNNYYRILQLKR